MTQVHRSPVWRAWFLLWFAGCHAYDEQLLESARTRLEEPRKSAPERAADSGEQEADAGRAEDAGRESGAPAPDAAALDSAVPPVAAAAGGAAGEAAGGGGASGMAGGWGAAGAAGSAAGVGAAGAVGAAGSPGPPPVACTEANALVWPVNGHCYIPLTVANSWFVSRDRCRELGAYLVTITSAEEQAFVGTFAATSTRWTGLSRFGAPAFSWVGDERVTYENWEPGAPKLAGEVAAVVRNETQLWFDAVVSDAHAPLCERARATPVTGEM